MSSPEGNKSGGNENEFRQMKGPERPRPRVNLKSLLFTKSLQAIIPKDKIQEERENFIKSARESHLSISKKPPEINTIKVPDQPPKTTSSYIPDRFSKVNSSDAPDRSSKVNSFNVPDKSWGVNSSSVPEKPLKVASTPINNVNKTFIRDKLPLQCNQKRNVKYNHFEDEDHKIGREIHNVFVKNCEQIDYKDRKVGVSVINSNDVEKKVNPNVKLNNRLIQPSQRNNLQSHSQFVSIRDSIKEHSNKNYNYEQETQKEESGWPQLDNEKDLKNNEECGWPQLDSEKDLKNNEECGWPQVNNEKALKINDEHDWPQVDKEKALKINEERGWPQVHNETALKINEERGWPQVDKERDVQSNKESGWPQLDNEKDLKNNENCGWPQLDFEKDLQTSCDKEGVWDDEHCSSKDNRMSTEPRAKSSYLRSTSMPYPQSKSISGGRKNSYEKENHWDANRSHVRNDATATKDIRNYQVAPSRFHHSRSFNDDGSGDCSGTFSKGGIRNDFYERSKWSGSEPHRPNAQLKRSKSLREKNGYEISKTNETLVKNRSFVNSQDSVHEFADSDSDSGAQVSRRNFNGREKNSFVKSRSQDRKTMVNSQDEQVKSCTADWNKAWGDKRNCASLQMKHPNTCKEFSNGIPEQDTKTEESGWPKLAIEKDLKNFNSGITPSSTYKEDTNSDSWNTVSETSDASVIELGNYDDFETRHTVIPTGQIDLSTGRPSFKITCRFEENHSKPETVSEDLKVNQSSAYKKPDELLNDIDGYSDPVEIFLQNCTAPDIPAPRPVIADSKIIPTLETSGSNLAMVDSPTTNKVLEHKPDTKQISEITSYLKEIEAEKSMPSNIADKVAGDIIDVIKYLSIKGFKVHIYGSYLSGLAVSTSNLNLALALNSDSHPKNSFLLQLQKEFSKRLQNYIVDVFEEDKNSKKSKICLTERDTGVPCELVYFGTYVSNHHKLSCVLQDVCQYDERIKTLLIATRIWAEVCLINEPEEGKLHTSGFTHLMLHFLQNIHKPVMPIINIQSRNWGLEPLEVKNYSSVGELWLEFLKYYSSEFNWERNVVTIHCKGTVLKSSKSWDSAYIAIEDLFTQKNIADTVETQECAEYIKSCFKYSYEYFLAPAESEDSDSDTSGNQDCISKKGTYSFNNIPLDQIMPSFCEECDELDDICEKCKPSKETVLRSFVEPLTKLSQSSLACVNKALEAVFKDYILPDESINERKAYVQTLERTIQKIYKSAKLMLFGSSVNGFGFKRSDLDICMTFGDKPLRGDEKSRILCCIVRHLRRDKDIENVFGLYHAVIPIVKFKYVPQGWHCDLSLYNILGVHNSNLLCKYALMDERCRIIGCALKLLAKKANINDTVSHTLSSYSYILMVIHYLQQVEPPVLPVLPIENKKAFDEYLKLPPAVLNGRNYWFSEDINALKKRYLPQPRNDLSVGELWLGLIDFLSRYDGTNAITITEKEPVPSASLNRCARLFNIEDPFLEKRNLGCVLNNNGVATTLKVLSRARFLFGKEIPEERRCDPKQYLFSSSNLTGQFVKEMECLSCGGFGHEKPNCEKDDPFKRCQKLGKPRRPYKRKV